MRDPRGFERREPPVIDGMTLFHGGCHGCTQQQLHGINFCDRCQYRNADWDKPDLNNKGMAVRNDDIRRIVREELDRSRGES